jgi:hypothetical protein
MTLDEQIDLLFKELSSKKEGLKELKRRISSKWKTNGEVILRPTGTKITLLTATQEQLADIVIYLSHLDKVSNTLYNLGINTDTVLGHSPTDLKADIEKRAAQISIQTQEKQITQLETRLMKIISPEQLRAMELAAIMKDMENL